MSRKESRLNYKEFDLSGTVDSDLEFLNGSHHPNCGSFHDDGSDDHHHDNRGFDKVSQHRQTR